MSYRLISHSVIKTRMQSLEARTQYRNSAHCAYRIFTEEGVKRFWKGTTPRLARLSVSRSSFWLAGTLSHSLTSCLCNGIDERRAGVHCLRGDLPCTRQARLDLIRRTMYHETFLPSNLRPVVWLPERHYTLEGRRGFKLRPLGSVGASESPSL
jgi:hypothetical protein